MKRRKNLERAIVLGLLLSTSVYGNAWAAEVGPIQNSNYNNDDNSGNPFSENVFVEANISDTEDDAIGNIILRDDKKYTVTIATTGGNIEFEKNDGSGILVAEGIASGTNVTLNASGNIIIDAGYGIQANSANREVGNESTITLSAQNNNITASKIGVYGIGKVDVELNAVDSNNIISTGDFAVKTDANSEGFLNITAKNGDNKIIAKNGSAIRANGHKLITIKAETGNNFIIGLTNGIQHNEFDTVKYSDKEYVVVEGVNNIIYGGANGLISDGAGITDIIASESNTIGQYTDEDNNVHTSNTGIEVTKGTVNVNSGNINSITATNKGISVTNGSVFVGGDAADKSANASTTITVTSDKDAYGIYAYKQNINEGQTGGFPVNINANVDVVSDKVDISVTGKNSSGDPTVAGVYFVNNEGETNIKTGNGGLTITASSSLLDGGTGSVFGIHTENTSNSTFTSSGNITITSTSNEKGNATGILSGTNFYSKNGAYNNSVIVSGKNINVNVSTAESEATGIETNYNDGATEGLDVNAIIIATDNININANNNSETGTGNSIGINVAGGTIEVTAEQGSTSINALRNEKNGDVGSAGINVMSASHSSSATVNSYKDNIINAGNAIYSMGEKSTAKITSQTANNEFTTSSAGVVAYQGSNVELYATQGANIINADATGIIAADYYDIGENSKVKLEALENQINSVAYGIRAAAKADVDLNAKGTNNFITVKDSTDEDAEEIITSAILADTASDVDLTADNSNILYAGELNSGYGKSYAINAIGQSDVDLTAGETNLLRGAVYASGHTDTAKTDVTLGGGANMVLSNAYIANAGGLADKNVISALYAENGANISLDGDYNILGTYAESSSDDLERVVWAYYTADIDITGLTAISTDSYDLATNSKDIAVVAGTATGLENFTPDDILDYSGDRANVDINYESDSSITGDILSAYAGTVNIAPNSENTRAASNSKIDIRGNLLAGNNGILNVDLGNGGTLTGRADDYGDAGLNTGHGAATGTENSFFNPAFSSEIIANGTVNLTMGEGSVWNVTGQSWITELNTTENAADTLINLEKAKEDYNTSASALTIGTLNGSTQFYMNLDGDRSASDMLYIKNANGKYDIYLQEEVTTGEINADGFDGLRFATVGEGSNADFTVKSQGTGSAFDVVYTVGTDSYAGNEENTAYNSTTGGNANTEKPGNASVNDFFGLTDTATEETPEAATNGIMLMAEDEEAADNAANANTGLDEVTNFKIIARAGEELNDTGETILNMSRANYSNAIYMDRLNKRLGEARYINGEEDEGMWVRIRHDRIGKTDAYRSQNTMYELGYDQKQDCDNGERRVGFAVDYMHGDTGYSDIAGKGEIDRYGLWLYDTWMGDKGHYVDYVAKWGHLSNDFEVYTMRNGDKVTGDYSNNVFSVSAEYGRKKDMGNDWYFEPQAQLQLARVTGADYTTNQGTKVSVDGINSLIGRAGFRLGKDFGEEKQSTVYIKADVLHEFLGDQDVYVYDKSSDNKWAGISYENEGTWYDVGFGFATMMSKNSYAFLDLEKSFGHDNDETYQINAGVQWTF